MPKIIKGKMSFEDDSGDIFYPETSADLVKTSDDKTLEDKITDIETKLDTPQSSISLGSLTIEAGTVLTEDTGAHPMDEEDEYPYYYQIDDERITANSMIVPVLPMSALRNGELAPFLTTFDGYARLYFTNDTLTEAITINDLVLSEVATNE